MRNFLIGFLKFVLVLVFAYVVVIGLAMFSALTEHSMFGLAVNYGEPVTFWGYFLAFSPLFFVGMLIWLVNRSRWALTWPLLIGPLLLLVPWVIVLGMASLSNEPTLPPEMAGMLFITLPLSWLLLQYLGILTIYWLLKILPKVIAWERTDIKSPTL